MSLSLEIADVMLPELLQVDENQDSLPPITVGLYRAFMAKGKRGIDAKSVYEHLLFTYRLQRTDKVWATNEYIENGLKMGERRIRIAKSLLAKMNLISTVREKDAKGRITKTYTRLSLLPNPVTSTSAESARVDADSPADRFRTGGPGPQMLEEEIKKSSASAQALPSQRPKTKKKTSDAQGGRLQKLFFELYHKKTGAARAPFNPACARQLKNDLERLGEDKLSRALRSIFETPPARMRAFDYMSVHHFLPDIEKRLADEDRRLRLRKTCRACGKASETSGIDCPKCGEPDAYQSEAARRAQ